MKTEIKYMCWHRPTDTFFTELGELPNPREAQTGTLDEARVWGAVEDADVYRNNHLTGGGWEVHPVKVVTTRSLL